MALCTMVMSVSWEKKRKKIASIGHTLEINEELQWYTYNNIYEFKKIWFQNKELKCFKMIQAKILKILPIIESSSLSGYSF